MNEATPPSNICGEVLTRVPAQRAAGRERDLYLTGGAAGQAPASLWRPSGSLSEAKGLSNEGSAGTEGPRAALRPGGWRSHSADGQKLVR